jgi:hypothetical protein
VWARRDVVSDRVFGGLTRCDGGPPCCLSALPSVGLLSFSVLFLERETAGCKSLCSCFYFPFFFMFSFALSSPLYSVTELRTITLIDIIQCLEMSSTEEW